MEWQTPQALYLILPLTAVWLMLALMSDRRRSLAREAFAARTMWSRIFPPVSSTRFWVKLILREVAIVSGLVALAGPQFGIQYEQVIPRGSDLYVMIDVSRSMLADDVPPTRLGRAKADVSSLINRLEGERIGLIAFAGQAVVKCPLTVDYDSFRRALDELDTDSAPRGGTAIGDAIRKALEVFHAKADRDQAILLITDGDDQQSYPLEAAAIAAERHVTIFAIGLGDSERGARIPRKGNDKSFTEYNDQQVWTKLDSSLLEQIALKTSGVYVPAGTRAYDLGELYTQHLHGRAGDDATAQQRIRRTERYQLFLALSLVALLIDLCIAPYAKSAPLSSIDSTITREPHSRRSSPASSMGQKATLSMWALIVWVLLSQSSLAIEPAAQVRDGLKLYSKGNYAEARDKFVSASEELEKQKSPTSAIAAFDEACALHRKGDLDQARECYLRAGLSSDRSIAISAHFNLGTLSAEQGKTLAGDQPEIVPPDKRQEVLDHLSSAVDAYRHCLELQSDHVASRRNLELIRQWIKYYSDKWHEIDRQKRRDESNLLQFLDFLTQTESSLKESVQKLPPNSHSDAFAELKRAQQELSEEIPTLRDKIARDLQPQASPGQVAPQSNSKELEEGIKLLQNWADTAGEKMASAAGRLGEKEPAKAVDHQQQAIDELEKIWEAVIPFQPLLTKELADQTQIKQTLSPKSSVTDQQAKEPAAENDNGLSEDTNEKSNQPPSERPTEQTEIVDLDFKNLEESQQKTLRRARMLGPKAEDELNRLASSAFDKDQAKPQTSGQPDEDPQPSAPDPEEAKAGLRKAIELAPQAIDEMEAAIKSLRQKDQSTAAEHAEEARRILEEIQRAQKKKDQEDQKKKDEQKKNQDKQQQDQQQQDKENQKQDEQKQDEQKKDDSAKKDDQQQQQKNQQQKQDKQQVSQDRVEAALRKVREREQEKRERDRKLKALFMGKVPVDKDW